MLVVAEVHVGQFELAVTFDVGLERPVDHDVGNGIVGQQRFEGPQAQHVVEQQLHDRRLLGAVEAQLLLVEDLRDDVAELMGQVLARQLGRGRNVQPVHDQGLDRLLGLGDRLGVRRRLILGFRIAFGFAVWP